MAEIVKREPRYAVFKEGNADCHITLKEWPIWKEEGWQWREIPPELKDEKGK